MANGSVRCYTYVLYMCKTIQSIIAATYLTAIIVLQDSDQVRFEPSLLPIKPSDESVTVVYGFPSLSPKEFHKDEVIQIALDTPYNVKRVSV